MCECIRLREERRVTVGSKRIDVPRSGRADDLGVIMILFNRDDDMRRRWHLRKQTSRRDKNECGKKDMVNPEAFHFSPVSVF